MQKATQAYIQTQVGTTSPGEILLMLYDGAINYLAQAKVKISAKDYAGKGILISKTLDIINELSSSLNKEKGGELANNLNNLYMLCSSRLAMANLKMDTDRIDEVIKILSGLRSAYAEILETAEAKSTDAEIAAAQRPDAASPMRTPLHTQAPTPQAMTSFSGAKRNSAYAQQQGTRLVPFTQVDVEKAEEEAKTTNYTPPMAEASEGISNNTTPENTATTAENSTPASGILNDAPVVSTPFSSTGFARQSSGFARYGGMAGK